MIRQADVDGDGQISPFEHSRVWWAEVFEDDHFEADWGELEDV